MIFRLAQQNEVIPIWKMFEKAIVRRKNEGSSQWQDGYPNITIIQSDIEKNQGFVLIVNDEIVAYCTLIFNDESAYQKIEGSWLSNEDFYVVHRVVVAENQLGKGFAKSIFDQIEQYVHSKNCKSIKVDTNFDNAPMLHLLKLKGYHYCGKIMIRNAERMAFEKII